jgi:hypothetical protein
MLHCDILLCFVGQQQQQTATATSSTNVSQSTNAKQESSSTSKRSIHNSGGATTASASAIPTSQEGGIYLADLEAQATADPATLDKYLNVRKQLVGFCWVWVLLFLLFL